MTRCDPSAATPGTSNFEQFLAEQLEDPEVRAGYEDHGALATLIDKLVGFRKVMKLTQGEVARRMGVTQPTVSGFETEMSDPRLSTLQRYARAVEARLEVRIDWQANCDWVSFAAPVTAYRGSAIGCIAVSSVDEFAFVRDWTEGNLRQGAPSVHREPLVLQA